MRETRNISALLVRTDLTLSYTTFHNHFQSQLDLIKALVIFVKIYNSMFSSIAELIFLLVILLISLKAEHIAFDTILKSRLGILQMDISWIPLLHNN